MHNPLPTTKKLAHSVLRLRSPGLDHNMNQFFMPRPITRFRLSKIVRQARKYPINWEGNQLEVDGTLASIMSVFNCTRKLRAKIIVQLKLRISGM